MAPHGSMRVMRLTAACPTAATSQLLYVESTGNVYNMPFFQKHEVKLHISGYFLLEAVRMCSKKHCTDQNVLPRARRHGELAIPPGTPCKNYCVFQICKQWSVSQTISRKGANNEGDAKCCCPGRYLSTDTDPSKISLGVLVTVSHYT